MEKSWGFLRERLDEKQPTYLEGREEFIQRLKAAVKVGEQEEGRSFMGSFQQTKRKE